MRKCYKIEKRRGWARHSAVTAGVYYGYMSTVSQRWWHLQHRIFLKWNDYVQLYMEFNHLYRGT